MLGVEEADRGTLTAALEAPTTEVFTGYNALQSTFAAAVRKFTSLVDAQPGAASTGYRGSAVLETVEDVAVAPAAVLAAPELVSWVGSAVKLVIGWTSREAHLEAKEKAGREFRQHPFSCCILRQTLTFSRHSHQGQHRPAEGRTQGGKPVPRQVPEVRLAFKRVSYTVVKPSAERAR